MLSSLKVAGRHLAGLPVSFKLEGDLLAFNKLAHASPLDCRDMHEGIRAAVVGLNEAEAFGGIEPFYCADGHE